MYEVHFFCTLASFSPPAAGLFSHSRPPGTQLARVYTRLKFGPRPGSVARVLGVQSRAIWQVFPGSLSDELERTRRCGNPQSVRFFSFSFFTSLLLFLKYLQLSKARQPRYNSRASSFSLCDSHERCSCVLVTACVRVVNIGSDSSRNQEHSQEQRCRSAFFCSFSFFLRVLSAAPAVVCLYRTESF